MTDQFDKFDYINYRHKKCAISSDGILTIEGKVDLQAKHAPILFPFFL